MKKQRQAAFAPSNLVPGIGPSPDRMLLGRLFSYPDAHRYRLGDSCRQEDFDNESSTRIQAYLSLYCR